MINITAPINDLSYGIVSKNIITQYAKKDIVCLKPIGLINRYIDCEYIKYVENYYKYFDVKSPSLRIFHEFDLMEHQGKGLRIGFPIFEKDQFNQIEQFNIKHQDLVIVCSEWAKNIVKTINANVEVVCLGVDEDFKPEPRIYNKDETKVIFYSCGKIEERKGHNYLHKVFAKAFPNENVELWMFCHNVFLSDSEHTSFKNEYRLTLGNRVKFFPRLVKHDLINWINQTDCGIFLSKAEGFNLCLLESMACGKDVIATYYSGHTEYLPKENAILPVSFCEANDGKWFHGGFNWINIESCEDQIIEQLHRVYKLKLENRNINMNNIEIASKLTWERSMEQLHGTVSKYS